MNDVNKETSDVRSSYHGLARVDVLPVVRKTGGTLLDVGGGVGATAAHYKAEGYVERAGAVDLVATENAAPGLDFHYSGNLEDPDFLTSVIEKEGPFKMALCLDVLEHLSDPWSLIRKLHEGLAPGGVIVASIPNIRYYRASFPLFFGNSWSLTDSGIMDRTHLRWFVRDTAIELMTHSGLTVEKIVDKAGSGRRAGLVNAIPIPACKSFTTVQFLIRAVNNA